ncbi:MAG: MBL fold metallo-hydrolase [Nannocystaceae bacterium]
MRARSLSAMALAVAMAMLPACRSGLREVSALALPAPPPGQRPPGVYVTWLGTAGVVIDDGQTRIAIDPFMSRDSLGHVLVGRPVESRAELVDRWLARTGGARLDAVVVTHSHYDHALDAPTVAARSGAVLVGSDATLQQARASRLDSRTLVPAQVGVPLHFGELTVTLRRSAHGDPEFFSGPTPEGFEVPTSARNYRTGPVYSVLVEHPYGTLLHHGSAARRPETYDASTRADVVLLGLAGRYETEAYLHDVVDAVGASRVIPIHYDDFFRPLSRPLRPLPSVDLDGWLSTVATRRPDLTVQSLPLGEPRRVLAAPVAGAGEDPAPCSAP